MHPHKYSRSKAVSLQQEARHRYHYNSGIKFAPGILVIQHSSAWGVSAWAHGNADPANQQHEHMTETPRARRGYRLVELGFLRPA